MEAARRRSDLPRPVRDEASVLGLLEGAEARTGSVDVDVHDIDSGHGPGGDPDVRRWPRRPPSRHRPRFGCGVVESVRRQGPLLAWRTREDRNAVCSQVPRSGSWRDVGCGQIAYELR